MTPEIHISPTPQALAEEAARRFAILTREAIGARGRFIVALSGGSTPKTLLRLLALPPYRGTLDWGHIHVAWGDERTVPPDELLPACYDLAEQIIGWSRPGVELTKRTLWSSLDAGSLAQHMNQEGIGQLFVRMLTDNFEEATRARKEKRTPVFRDMR